MPYSKADHDRGYLPHLINPGATYFVTWRTADSLPHHVFEEIHSEASTLSEDKRLAYTCQKIDQFLDGCRGDCPLHPNKAGAVMQEVLLQGTEYDLDAYVIMPNHVHILVRPVPEERTLSEVLQLIKGRGARQINLALQQSGRLWQRESYDRLIRSEDHHWRTAHYIHQNPVRAGLSKQAHEWPLSSATKPTGTVVNEHKFDYAVFDPFEDVAINLDEIAT